MSTDPEVPDNQPDATEPTATDHPTGEDQAAENEDNELAG
jgi:hypothetical protein